MNRLRGCRLILKGLDSIEVNLGTFSMKMVGFAQLRSWDVFPKADDIGGANSAD